MSPTGKSWQQVNVAECRSPEEFSAFEAEERKVKLPNRP